MDHVIGSLSAIDSVAVSIWICRILRGRFNDRLAYKIGVEDNYTRHYITTLQNADANKEIQQTSHSIITSVIDESGTDIH